MNFIHIGKIVNAVGLKGEVKVYSYSENLDRFETIDRIFIKDKESDHYEEIGIEGVRYKALTPILKLSGVSDRNSSEALKGVDIYMSEEDLEDLEEGVFYVKDMIGMDVISDKGLILGKLKDIITNTPQKLYVVERTGKKDILIPGVDEFILNIDMHEKKIEVKVIEGLYED